MNTTKVLLVLCFLITFPSYGHAQLNFPPSGRYVVTASRVDGQSTILVDSVTGQSWVLIYISDKNGNTIQYSWKPVTYESLKDNLIYIYPVQNDAFKQQITSAN